jgi:NADH dehydrogenase
VVVVGGGFGGLRAVRGLRRAPVEVVLVDKRNFHLFQPLLYQVATGSLVSGEIASPLRAVLRRQHNAKVVMGEVMEFDLDARELLVRRGPGEERLVRIPYDTLVVAAGARHSYFGHDEWQPYAPGLKTIEDALELRRRILFAFEAAEVEPDAELRRQWLTFVVVGGGPTGAELAGQIAEIARDTMRGDFRSVDPGEARILLVEATDRVLPSFHPKLSASAVDQLAELGVEIRLGHLVTNVEPGVVEVSTATGPERIDTRTVVWAAGVAASPLAAALASATGAEVDRNGRVSVLPDLTLPGHPEVFALGDMVTLADPRTGRPLPGVAPVAMQQGLHVARLLRDRLAGGPGDEPFRYKDKGNLATIGRARAVAEIRGLRFTGLAAWALWLVVHLLYLIGFQNRLLVMIRWGFSFATHGRGARLITVDNWRRQTGSHEIAPAPAPAPAPAAAETPTGP